MRKIVQKAHIPDSSTQTCEKCHRTCLTCSGSTYQDCLSCNYSFYSSGVCGSLTCQNGEFEYFDDIDKTAICEPCPSSCSECTSATNCTACNEGYHLNASSLCFSCGELHKGFTEGSDGTCTEICGDGYNYGFHDCDDGNKRSGDGCSSSCTIESGYLCTSTNGSKDVCTEILNPSAELTVLTNNQLQVVFTESVVITADYEDFIKSISLSLIGGKCAIEWTVSNQIQKSVSFKTISISTTIQCSVKGNSEKFQLTFSDPTLIQDISGNSFTN